MFDAIERKLLLDTLHKRCAWLKKTIGEDQLAPKALAEHKAMYQALLGASKKIEKITPIQKIMPATAHKPAPPKKRHKHSIPFAEAHVLIAEDDSDSAMLLEGIIEDLGIKHIAIAKDGREAVHALKNASPSFDIVLCDWDMPELSGLEVKREVSHLAKLQETHFIMVTAVSASARIKEAIAQGITDYVIKPVDASIIEKKITAALAGDSNTMQVTEQPQPAENGSLGDTDAASQDPTQAPT